MKKIVVAKDTTEEGKLVINGKADIAIVPCRPKLPNPYLLISTTEPSEVLGNLRGWHHSGSLGGGIRRFEVTLPLEEVFQQLKEIYGNDMEISQPNKHAA